MHRVISVVTERSEQGMGIENIFLQNEVLIIDVRGREHFKMQHIKGSYNLPEVDIR